MKLRIASPLYNGQCASWFLGSMLALQQRLIEMRLPHDFALIHKCTYIPQGRNKLAVDFLASDCTHLLFLDSDMAWNVDDVIRLLAFANKPEYSVIGGAYFVKQLDWERVKQAILANPEIAPELLPYVAVERPVFAFDRNVQTEIEIGKPYPVDYVGTGVMCIQRTVLEQMKDTLKPFTKEPGWPLFNTQWDDDGSYIGEDWFLCRRWRAMGGTIWLAPWLRSEHFGPFSYPGDFAKILAAGGEINA